MTLASVGTAIKNSRIEKGWIKRNHFAAAIELDASYVRSIENGTRNITIRTLRKIAYFLNVDIFYFLRDEDGDPYATLRHYMEYNVRDFIVSPLTTVYVDDLFVLLESEMLDKVTLLDIINGSI